MDKILEKWKGVIDLLDVDDDKKLKLAQYAEHHVNMEIEMKQVFGESFQNSSLPMSLKILSKLDDFYIIKDPSDVKDHILSYEINNGAERFGLDVITMTESLHINEIVNKLKGKKIGVYLMVSSVSVINEGDYPSRYTVKSRIKID